MRSSDACTSSRADNSPPRTRAARSDDRREHEVAGGHWGAPGREGGSLRPVARALTPSTPVCIRLWSRSLPPRSSPAARPTGTGSADARRWTSSTRGASAGAGNIECLCSAADLAQWLTRAELLERPAPAGRGMLAAAVELREAIDAGVRAAVAGERPDPGALVLIDGWLELAAPRPALRRLARRRAAARRARRGRSAGGRPGRRRARRRADARPRRRARARAHLRLGHLLGPLLRPLAGRAPALVLDGRLRERRQGAAAPRTYPLRPPERKASHE